MITYAYDGLQRLTAATESPGTSYAYGYDLAGNRTAVTVNGSTTTTTYNLANQITNAGYSYDLAGNLTNDGTAAATYDALNRTTARGGTTYGYNGDGTLVSQLTAGVTTRYTQDLAAPLSQVLQTFTGTPRTDYLYGLSRLATQTSTVRTWYVSDALGSVRRTVSDAGVPLGVVTYDPWGSVESGTVPIFGFTGELQQGGAVYLRARWYSSAQGRFGSVDPAAGAAETPYSFHPYQYAYADPVRLTDASGLYACDAGSLNPFRWLDLARYYRFCEDMRTALLENDPAFTEAQRVANALNTLLYLFSNPDLPGGSGARATKLRRSHLTPAQERLEFILWLTADGHQAHFAHRFSDKGFNAQFQDAKIHAASGNQVGHFLTAVDLGYAPLFGSDAASWFCIVGHEQSADNSGNGDNFTSAKQCGQPTFTDIGKFEQAITADLVGDIQLRDCLVTELVGPHPEARVGNSVQDLRLSIKGWIFGHFIQTKKITTIPDAYKWVVKNLR